MNISENQIAHRQYLKTSKWNDIRIAALKHYGKICAKCNQYGTDVHHLTYPLIQGEEEISDLIVLCRSCHESIHSAERGCSGSDSIHIIGLFNYLTNKQKDILSLKLKSPLYSVFMSDTPEGENVRNIALKMLDVKRYYGLKKNKVEKLLTLKKSKKIQEINNKNKQQKELKKQIKWQKLLEESNPKLYRKIL